MQKKRKQHAPPRHGTNTAEAPPGRVRKGEQGEARRAKGAPNGGAYLELVYGSKPCVKTTFEARARHLMGHYTYICTNIYVLYVCFSVLCRFELDYRSISITTSLYIMHVPRLTAPHRTLVVRTDGFICVVSHRNLIIVDHPSRRTRMHNARTSPHSSMQS